MTAPGGRVVAIDVVKGAAILGVLFIHSQALGPVPFFTYVVNHAVPVFVVLFGVNSTFWWRRRALPVDLGTWLRGRFERILVPLWASLPVWWAAALWYRPFGVFFPHWLPLAHLLGYTVYIGTGWFVTLVIQLVLWFPLLEGLRRRLGMAAVLALAGATTVAAIAARFWIAEHVRETWLGFPFFNFLVFSPRFLMHVAFGMWLAGRVDRLGLLEGALATAAWFVCAAVLASGSVDEFSVIYVDNLLDLPLTVMLLVALRPLAAVPVLGAALVWLGESSYGIYLGQMLAHNVLLYRFGMFDVFNRIDQWLYTGLLLVGGVLAVFVGEALRELTGRLHRAGLPIPDLAR